MRNILYKLLSRNKKLLKWLIYRRTLWYLKRRNERGICYCLDRAIIDVCGIYGARNSKIIKNLFPLFLYTNAHMKFKATGLSHQYWWPIENREIRREFLKYCYKNKL